MRRHVWILAALLFSLGCTTTNAAIKSGTETIAEVVMPPSEEIKLGLRLSAEIEKELKIHTDPAVQAYIQGLGAKISRAAAKKLPEGITLKFKVVDDPNTINAFAMPGGHIYVYSGLLLAASDEAEVMGVLGHEAAHVTERHVAERLVAAYGLQALTDITLGQNPGQLTAIVASLAGQGYLLKYGRDQESESDRVGLGFVLRSGYSPAGMVTFFEKLAKSAQPPTFMSSHPHPGDRAKALQAMIDRQASKPTETGKAAFDAIYPKFKTAAAPAPQPAPEATPAP